MRKVILLLTLSGLVLGLSVMKLTGKLPGERGIIVAVLDAGKVSVPNEVKMAGAPEEAASTPAQVVVASEKTAGEVPPVRKSRFLNEEEAVMIALGTVPGELGKVEYKEGHYKVKIYSGQGKKARVYVHAETGEVDRIKMKS